jgi:hypothetical protein
MFTRYAFQKNHDDDEEAKDGEWKKENAQRLYG